MAGDSEAGQEHWLQLDVKIDKICNSVDHVKDKQEHTFLTTQNRHIKSQ